MSARAASAEYRRKSHASAMRATALDKAEGTERAYRGLVNLFGFAWLGVVAAIEWSALLTGRAVLLGLIGWLVVRTIGNAILNAWAAACIRRIEAEWPTEDA